MRNNNLISNIKLFFQKIKRQIFSSSNNRLEKIIFNTIIITLFISVLLTMGFTRIFPLNIILKISLLIANIFIIFYLLFFSNIKIDVFTIIMITGFCWIGLTALLNGTISRDSALLLNILNMIPLYLFASTSDAAKKTILGGVVSGLVAYTLSFVIYYARSFLSFDLSVRLGLFFGNQNDVAFTLVMGTIVFMFYVFKKHYAFIPLVLMSFISLFSTGSRAGLLVAFLVSYAMFLFILFKNNKKLVIGGIILLVVVTITLLFLPMMKPLVDRFIDMIKTLLFGSDSGLNTDYSTLFRMQALINSIQLFLFSPLFGSDFTTLSFSEKQMVAHNAYAELLMSQGIISFLLFLLLFLYPIIKIKREKRTEMSMYFFVILGLMFFLFTLSGLHFKEVYIFLVLAAARLNGSNFVEISIHKETTLFLIRKKALFLSQTNLEYFKPENSKIKQKLVVVDGSLKDEYKNICNSLMDEGFNFFVLGDIEQSKSIESEFDGSKSLDLNREGSMNIIKMLRNPNTKILIIADREKFKSEAFSLNFYKKLFERGIDPIANQGAVVSKNRSELSINDEGYTNEGVKQPKIKKISYSKMMPTILFFVFFNFLSVISFSFAITSVLLWQKIVFSVFCLVYTSLASQINYKEIKYSKDTFEDFFGFMVILACGVLLTLLFSVFGVIKEKNLTWLFLLSISLLNRIISILLSNLLIDKERYFLLMKPDKK